MQDVSPQEWGLTPQKHSKVEAMDAAAEAHRLIAEIAGPLELGGRIKTALCRVAMRAGIPERRVRGLWHRERTVKADELDALRRAARAKQKAEIDAEISELRARLARLEETLAMASANAGRAASQEVRGPMGGLRDVDRL